jgi:flagellar biosynthesis/type III secretory pathway protein FliH
MNDDAIFERQDATPWRSIMASARVLDREAFAAQRSADTIRDQEKRKGYQDGFTAGHLQGLGEWISAAAAFHARLRELTANYDEVILFCVGQLAERAFGGLLQSEEALAALIRQAGQEYGTSDCVAISAHPERITEIARAKAAGHLAELEHAKVRPDPNLRPDDLVLEYEGFAVDYGLKTIVANGVAALRAGEER